MSNVPAELKYAASHEWLRTEDDGSITIGITDHAQEALGDLVYVELPENGDILAAGQACAVVESVKAASDVYSPVTGTVVAMNNELADAPELVNEDPYGKGWLFRVQPDSVADDLLDAATYQDRLADA